MRRVRIWIALLSVATVAGNVSAFTVDGDWSDWFSYGGNTGQNTWDEMAVTTNPGIRTANDEEGPSPGVGGQTYDIEQIFYSFEDADPNNVSGGALCIGLVTGFPPDGDPILGFEAGDLFLDPGNTGTFTLAVGISTAAADAARFEQLWFNTGAPNWTTLSTALFHSSNPYRVDETQPGAQNVSAGANVQVAVAQTGVHYFYEICFDVDGSVEDQLTNLATGGLGLHWTMECGNDVINVRDDEPLIPVPEPSTFALLGDRKSVV